jgi:uncharacterized membrane protein YedE/YeeE
MNPDWLFGFSGGLLIGSAAAIYLLVNGRIMGASGVLGGLLDGTAARGTWAERLAFLVALTVVPAIIAIAIGGATTHLTTNVGVIVVAGLLVGLGTRLAGGCTSGHGVCGISRLSPRGIVATVVYILAGGGTVLLFRHWIGMI